MKNVLFDLDGTILPMDVEEFTQKYIGGIIQTMNNNKRNGKEIAKAVFAGVSAMIKSDGTLTNEELFWNVFKQITNISKEDIEDEFMFFYENMFDDIDSGIRNENMVEAVSLLKQKGYKLYLTTNPLFPAIATYKRVKWAGLNTDDFELITTFENSHFCKPNIQYYQEVINKCHLDIHECLMVGNDVLEDGIIETIGVPVYIVNDYLINKENKEIKTKYQGSSVEFLEFVRNLDEIKAG